MYLDHFGLREAPFSITPHTELFFPGANRGAMLDALCYAITHDEGIIKVTGEVGSGKTMLCRMLLEKLPKHVETVYLATPTLSREDILHAIAAELDRELTEWRTHQLTRALQDRLLEIHTAGRRVVVLIDEAHAMPAGTLEEIRLLSNLETNRHKLLHIVLFGQPELDDRLNQYDMRQLKDRITHHFALEPLHRNDIGNYLMFRLRAAGYRGPDPFSAEAVQRIHTASQGLTRRINILADKALLAAFSQGQHLVSGRLAKIAIRDSRFTPMRNHTGRKPWWIASLAALALLGAGGWWAAATGRLPPIPMLLVDQIESAPQARPITGLAQQPALATAPREEPAAAPKEAASPENSAPDPATPPTLDEQLAATEAWLRQIPDTHYSIQLFSADENLAEVERFLDGIAADLDLRQIHVHRSETGGRSHFNVIYGDYPSRETVESEMSRLFSANAAIFPRILPLEELKAKHRE